METATIFRVILPVLILAFMAHRGYYTRKFAEPQHDTLKKRDEGPGTKLAGLFGIIGLSATIVYLLNPAWLAWASLPFPAWLRAGGVGAALLGFVLLQWAQNTLGKSWSDTPRMIRGQMLVTSGPYRWVRHPIYTAFLLILGSILLISANGLVGLAWLGMTSLEIAARIGFEEALMIEYFGDQYREYMGHTGRYLPKIVSVDENFTQ